MLGKSYDFERGQHVQVKKGNTINPEYPTLITLAQELSHWKQPFEIVGFFMNAKRSIDSLEYQCVKILDADGNNVRVKAKTTFPVSILEIAPKPK